MSEYDMHYYRCHPSGIECVEIAEHLGYRLGSAFAYIWRAGLKTESPFQDFGKAIWYLDRERLKRASGEVVAYPLPEEIIRRAHLALDHESNGRREALRAILWAASNNDPADVINAIDAVRSLVELGS